MSKIKLLYFMVMPFLKIWM